MVQVQLWVVLPELGNEGEDAARHFSELALPYFAMLLRQFILLRLFYDLGLDLDKLLQLSDVNIAALQGLCARPCWNAPLHR
jgi:hypothetical protein